MNGRGKTLGLGRAQCLANLHDDFAFGASLGQVFQRFFGLLKRKHFVDHGLKLLCLEQVSDLLELRPIRPYKQKGIGGIAALGHAHDLAAHQAEDELEHKVEFARAGKPVFGICRGLQMLNVTFGGTLWQDIKTQVPNAVDHIRPDMYERNLHPVEIVPGTHLASLYPDTDRGMINSIHHQSIRELAPEFVVEARCPDDGIIEAIRWTGPGFISGVQWHPEFRQKSDTGTFDDNPILINFLQYARDLKR